MGEEIVTIIAEGEHERPSPITHADIAVDVLPVFAEVNWHVTKHNVHHLLVLLGPPGQAGSVRKITAAHILQNPLQGWPFENPDERVYALQRYMEETKIPLAVLGVGSGLGIQNNADHFLKIAGYDLYYSGTDQLAREVQVEGKRVIIVPPVLDFSQYRLYAKDAAGKAAVIQDISVSTPVSFGR